MNVFGKHKHKEIIYLLGTIFTLLWVISKWDFFVNIGTDGHFIDDIIRFFSRLFAVMIAWFVFSFMALLLVRLWNNKAVNKVNWLYMAIVLCLVAVFVVPSGFNRKGSIKECGDVEMAIAELGRQEGEAAARMLGKFEEYKRKYCHETEPKEKNF